MANFTVAGLRSYYLAKWNNMVITRSGAVDAAARHVIAGMNRYKDIEKQTGVPWKVIGIIHLRESDCNFYTHLHNGDPLTRRTYHVPAGRPLRGMPPFTFEYSAIDALTMEGFTKIKDWTIEQIAFCFEQYNGWGYRYHGMPSAYLWSGTNQYSSGKYVSDGVFDPGAVDVQLGTMAVLKRVMEITKESYSFNAPAVPAAETAVIVAPPTSSVPQIPHIPSAIEGGKASVPTPTSKDMAQTSRKYYWTSVVSAVTKVGAGFLATIQALDISAVQMTQQWVNTVKTFISENGLYIALLALIAYALYTSVLKDWMKQDVVAGRSTPSGQISVGLAPPPDAVVHEAPSAPVEPTIAQPAPEAPKLPPEARKDS